MPEAEDDRADRDVTRWESCSVSPRITMSPHPMMARPLRFQARSVRSSARRDVDGCGRRGGSRARSLDDHQHEAEDRDDGHDDRHDQREPGAGQRAVVAHRLLVAAPLPVAHRRDHDAEPDQWEADEPAPAREVERRQQLGDGEARGDEAERGALPRQERALVGERQLDVGLVPAPCPSSGSASGAASGSIGCSSWRTASVTPVTDVGIEGSGAAAVTGAVTEVVTGIDRGLHLGAQLYVSIDGKAVADLGIGEARAGVPMTPDSMVVWFSMTKPSVAVAIAQQWERGNLELDDRVADHLPEFATHGKDTITLRHLLTHTAGIRGGDAVVSHAPGLEYWDEIVAGICAIIPEADWVPGAARRATT